MKKIFIVGSLNYDLVINAPYMPVGGETIKGSDFMTNAGGKGANQAYAAARLGGDVYMCGGIEFDSKPVHLVISSNPYDGGGISIVPRLSSPDIFGNPNMVQTAENVAAKYGITTSVENHGFYVQSSERVRRLVVAVGRNNFRTTLDVGNFLCVDEDPVSAVKNNLPYASMIHFKDFHIRRQATPPPDTAGYIKTLHDNYIRGAITGDGDVDLDTISKLIKASDYDGFLSVEFEGWGDCIEGCTRAMKNVLAIFERN
jgi:sugar phosphate isomerase/epimerase